MDDNTYIYIKYQTLAWWLERSPMAHCRLFNAISFIYIYIYIYIKYIWFGWVGFYGVSTIVGYLTPNPFYIYILNIYDLVWLGFMAYQPL